MATINEIMAMPLTQLQTILQNMNSFNQQIMSQMQNGIMSMPTPFGATNGAFPALPALPTFGNGSAMVPVQPITPISPITTRVYSSGGVSSAVPAATKKIALEVL